MGEKTRTPSLSNVSEELVQQASSMLSSLPEKKSGQGLSQQEAIRALPSPRAKDVRAVYSAQSSNGREVLLKQAGIFADDDTLEALQAHIDFMRRHSAPV
jgi:hypothetical protein